ncbi:MAG: universal stress protein [Betaproteobacteria bacterium]|nr:universal stress protein [Betaproteobacteria bacterium]
MDAATAFIQLDLLEVVYLLVVGFIGGLVSGFIGSGGAFVLTPAMMSMDVPAIVAVASNMCHKFPKALVGAIKRARYGHVDVKLGIVIGVSAEAGVLYGAHLQESIKRAFGDAGSNLYVSLAFVVVLAVVGGYVLWDAIGAHRGAASQSEEKVSRLARCVQAVNIPYTMMYFRSLDARVSVLFTMPLGFATGMLASTIAVGGFIGVPGMHYLLGAPSLMASATELVVAFVMGLGGTIKYGWSGLVDVRLAMIILAGSLFGIQLGAIGTTYVRPHMIKVVMGTIMVLVLVSRALVIPVYLSDLGLIGTLGGGTARTLKGVSFGIMLFALATGAFIILAALQRGMRAQRRAEQAESGAVEPASVAGKAVPQLSPLGRFERVLLASDGSEFSAGAQREALRLAKRCNARIRAVTFVASDLEQEAMGEQVLKQELNTARAHLDRIAAQAAAAGVECETEVIQGSSVHEQILEECERFRADLVIVGRRGRGALARIMVGDTTLKLVGSAHCSVLVVPRTAEVHGRRFVVASDGSRFGDAAAVAAGSIAKRFDTQVTVVSVAVPSHPEARRKEAHGIVDRIVGLLRSDGVGAEGEVPVGLTADMILATAARASADLIIMGSRGRNRIERLLLGSNLERVLNRCQCAALVVKTA